MAHRAPKSKASLRSLLRLAPYIARYKWPFAWGMVCLVLCNAFAVWGWAWVMRAIDEFSLPGADKSLAGPMALTSLAIFGIGAVFRFEMRWLLSGISRLVEYDFRNDIFAHLARLSPSFYDRRMTGDLMARATNDLDAVRSVLGPGLMYPVNALALLPLALAQMLRISPALTLAALAPLLAMPIFVKVFGQAFHVRFRAVQDYFSEMSARTQENLAGQRVVKAFTREEDEIALFQRMNEEFRRRNMKLMTAQACFFPIVRILIQLGMAALIWAGAASIAGSIGQPGAALTYGGLFAFIGLYQESIFPVISVGWVVNVIQRGGASMNRIAEILDVQPEIAPPDECEPPSAAHSAIRGRIEFRNLTFSYNGAPVLRGIDIAIEPGKTLGVVGPVGSGKSTLLALIPRLYSPPRGQLWIDGRDVNDIPVSELRRAVGMVPQETFLFSDTLRENIAFGLDEPPLEAVRRAAALAQLDEAIVAFPQGYDTMIGERGINLSGGQRQRAAIARALLRDPAVLLLDDCLSSVDTQTEERILSGLREKIRGRTAILVSHRISTVAMADEIVVLDEGRIVERGTHERLLALDGLYAGLYRRQRLIEQIERENGGALAAGGGGGG